jgi:hypothetical protein
VTLISPNQRLLVLLYAYHQPDLADLAATLAFGITRNHPFMDGNKRASFFVSVGFLRLNGYDIPIENYQEGHAWIFGAEQKDLPPLDRAEKLQQVLKVESLVVPHAEMAAVWADDGAGVRHQQGHLPHVLRIHLIPSRTDRERLDFDPVQLTPSIPVLLIAGDHELAGTEHLPIRWFG